MKRILAIIFVVACLLVSSMHLYPAHAEDFLLWETLEAGGIGPKTIQKPDGTILLSPSDAIKRGELLKRVLSITKIVTLSGTKRDINLREATELQDWVSWQLEAYSKGQ